MSALVLASASPRRAALLEAAGLPFVVDPVDVDETPLEGEAPEPYVRRLALTKARAGSARHPEQLVLGADTTVVIDDLILAKPDDEAHARAMLERLSGRTHEVLTGVALVGAGLEQCAVACTRVSFQAMTGEEIAWYVASGEPLGKAGAYAIQGLASRFIDRIEGSHPNVMGLPVELVYRMIRDRGGVRRTA